MPGFDPDLVLTAREVLERKGITIMVGNPIESVSADAISFKDGQTLTKDLLIWAGGVRGHAILSQSGFAVTPKGRGKTDPFLRAVGFDRVYLVGDSAAFIDPATGRELPPSGQAAVQMGKAAARNIRATAARPGRGAVGAAAEGRLRLPGPTGRCGPDRSRAVHGAVRHGDQEFHSKRTTPTRQGRE